MIPNHNIFIIYISRLQMKRLEEEKEEFLSELDRLRDLTQNGTTPVDVVFLLCCYI